MSFIHAIKWIGITAGGGTIFAGTFYVTYEISVTAPDYKPTNAEREKKFDVMAPDYDRGMKQQEFMLGLGRLRRRMLRDFADGRVLEVGCGTGTNVQLYPGDTVTEVILSDKISSMVKATTTKIVGRLGYDPHSYAARGVDDTSSNSAVKKVDGEAPLSVKEIIDANQEARDFWTKEKAKPAFGYDSSGNMLRERRTRRASFDGVAYSIGQFSAESIPFPDNSFDTVVDMFGLCSFDDPILALNEMSRVCKPDGKLILLEHGRGTWEFINDYLDKWAPKHANDWGCWFNRDIRRQIRMAGLHPYVEERSHFGTSQVFVALPSKPGMAKKNHKLAAKRAQALRDDKFNNPQTVVEWARYSWHNFRYDTAGVSSGKLIPAPPAPSGTPVAADLEKKPKE